MENSDDFKVEDSDEFRNIELSIKQIVLNHFNKCILEGSKEMSKGGIITKETRWGVFKVDVPNQQEIFRNSVEQMLVIMNPQIKENKDIKKRIDEIKTNIEKDLKDGQIEVRNIKQTKEKNIIQTNPQSIVLNKSVAISNINRNFEVHLITVYRNILIVISDLLAELNYFDEAIAQ